MKEFPWIIVFNDVLKNDSCPEPLSRKKAFNELYDFLKSFVRTEYIIGIQYEINSRLRYKCINAVVGAFFS